ncbi:hypothetical protein EAE96_010356 [Botrytis aclada]|nr:hypothetical protein EAE96_010356 [Botrytis aclada]
MEEIIDIAAAYRLGVTTNQRVFLNDETKEEPKMFMFETGVSNGYLKNLEGSTNMSNTLGVSG